MSIHNYVEDLNRNKEGLVLQRLISFIKVTTIANGSESTLGYPFKSKFIGRIAIRFKYKKISMMLGNEVYLESKEFPQMT